MKQIPDEVLDTCIDRIVMVLDSETVVSKPIAALASKPSVVNQQTRGPDAGCSSAA